MKKYGVVNKEADNLILEHIKWGEEHLTNDNFKRLMSKNTTIRKIWRTLYSVYYTIKNDNFVLIWIIWLFIVIIFLLTRSD